ncbi:MAG: hypothetical protein V5A30_04000 [Haloarculaceae archaeon]
MDTSRLVVVAAVLAAVGMTVVAPVAAFAPAGPVPQAGGNGTADNGTADDAADNGTVNGSFGTQVTSFMQASAASANSSVESGVWQASVNRSAQPERAVENRAAALDRRLDRLQNRSEALAAMRGELPEVAYTARASAIRAQIDSLRTAISEANETAKQVGVNTTRLDRLRDRAANMTGPEVAALARNITDVRRGPPPGAGPSNGTPGEGAPGNGTAGPPGEGPPGQGPPDSAGNGTDSPGNGGPPDDRGNGQDDDGDADGQDNDGAPTDNRGGGSDDDSDDGSSGSSSGNSGGSSGSGSSDGSGGPGNS